MKRLRNGRLEPVHPWVQMVFEVVVIGTLMVVVLFVFGMLA
jgi:hypothetical protein